MSYIQASLKNEVRRGSPHLFLSPPLRRIFLRLWGKNVEEANDGYFSKRNGSVRFRCWSSQQNLWDYRTYQLARVAGGEKPINYNTQGISEYVVTRTLFCTHDQRCDNSPFFGVGMWTVSWKQRLAGPPSVALTQTWPQYEDYTSENCRTPWCGLAFVNTYSGGEVTVRPLTCCTLNSSVVHRDGEEEEAERRKL